MWLEPRARLGLRLKAARRRAGLTQQQLADGLGLKHRQIVGRMEDGRRSITAVELLRATDLLGVDVDYFTDPFHLGGEGEFTFRTDPSVAKVVVDEFEEQAGRWIAMYRELSAEQGRKPRWLDLKLALSPRSSLSEANDAGEAFADHMELGDCPAETLRSVMEGRLGTPVLDVDGPPQVLAAACRVQGVRRTHGLFHFPGVNCVLVGRSGSEGRRNFDLAYELFHLLTWDAMPPGRTESVDVPRRGKGWHLERLAERFASAVLMPWPLVRQHWEWTSSRSELLNLMRDGAVRFRVSRAAYKWRLRDLRLLSREQVKSIDDGMRTQNDGMPIEHHRLTGGPACKPPLFNREFAQCVAIALEEGNLSTRRAVSVLDLSLPELATLLHGYGHEVDFEA